MPLRFTENNEVIREESCRAILVGLQDGRDWEASMEELAGLAEAAGAEILGQLTQPREKPDAANYLGSGKALELRDFCLHMEADTVICNDELSGIQYRNLDELLGVRVIDRTMLILDIFAARAVSKEGKLQVEMAQLQYRLPRLKGYGNALSRLGGGIGTRGPGEKKLETDRRHIQSRMDEIRRELREVRNDRQTQRALREKSGIPVAALVGYTNAGKSAILNHILSRVEREDKMVTERDMLFATLDTFQRRVQLESNHAFVLIDTVGFVSKLPHSLVSAFKATLEESLRADLLLHVVDASDPAHEFHRAVTERVLQELGAGEKPCVLLYNKADRLPPEEIPSMEHERCGQRSALWISARSGMHMDQLLEEIKARLFAARTRVTLCIPYARGELQSYLCDKYPVEETEYLPEGIRLRLELDEADLQRLREFRQTEA